MELDASDLPDTRPEKIPESAVTAKEEFPEFLQLAPLDHAILFERWVPWAAYSYRLMPIIPGDVSLSSLVVPPGTFGLGEEFVDEEDLSDEISAERVAERCLSVVLENGEDSLQYAMSTTGEFLVRSAKVSPVIPGWGGRLIEASVSLGSEFAKEWVSEARTILSEFVEIPLARIATLFLPDDDKPMEGKFYVAVYPVSNSKSSAREVSLSPREAQREVARSLFIKHALWRRDTSYKNKVIISANPRAVALSECIDEVLANEAVSEEEEEARRYVELPERRQRSVASKPNLEGVSAQEASALALAYIESMEYKPTRIALDDPRVVSALLARGSSSSA